MKTIATQSFGKQLNELLVLATLRAGARHGYQIALDAAQRSGGTFSLQHGTLYPILYRLEKQRLIRGRWTAESGRRRKEYELTHAGASRLRDETGALRQTFDRVLRMLEPSRDSFQPRGVPVRGDV